MNKHQKTWQRLAAAARAHQAQDDTQVPYGFAVRVASRAATRQSVGSWGLLEKFAVRGLIAACTMGLVATAYGIVGTGGDQPELAAGDPVGEILDRS